MALQGATATVAAGAVSASVSGTFGSAYQVGIAPAWNTSFLIPAATKLATGFVVDFGVAAPAGGSQFDWIVSAPTVSTSEGISGASVAVTAGATSRAITTSATLPSIYQVTVSTSWNTGYWITGKSTTGFTVNFAVPPVVAGTLDYTIFGPAIGTVSLSDYLDELRDLLHDPNDRYWSAIQKGDYINRAIKRRDMDTAANRSTITFTLTAGTGTYTFAQVGNGQVFDVISIVLLLGNQRIVLANPSLTELNQYVRVWTTMRQQPQAWARQGPSTVILGPTPGVAYSTEWDCCVYANPLVALTDTDPLPYPYTQPVPYYAAYLAKINERQMADEAADFLAAYDQLVGIATNARAGMVVAPYRGLTGLR